MDVLRADMKAQLFIFLLAATWFHRYAAGQSTCADKGFNDNLSCPPDASGNVTCLTVSDICDDIETCSDGADEGETNSALDCKFHLSAVNTYPTFLSDCVSLLVKFQRHD